MKCLTIGQPWAWAIIHGPKRIENRSWRTPHRGLLLIHAGKSNQYLCDRLNDGTSVPSGELVYGAILGTVELIDCVPVTEAGDDPFAEGPICWMLTNPRPFVQPIPWRGGQRLFDVPASALTQQPSRPC